MSYNGSGQFSINTTGQPVAAGTTITASVFNALTADLATGLSTAITKDGQTTVTADIPMAGFKITGLGAGVSSTDAARISQLQSSASRFLTISGTDTITATASPTYTAYVAGDMFSWVVGTGNTGAATLNIDTLGAKAITKNGSVALVAGDMPAGAVVTVIYDGTRFQLVNVNIQTNLVWVDGGGTADAITGTYTPAIVTLIDGMLLGVRATAANATTTPTFSPNGLTARTIVKNGNVALAVGDIVGDGHELLLRYRLSDTKWELLNPKSYATPTTTRGDLIYRGASADQRLAIGTANLALISDGTDPGWGTVVRPGVTNTLTKGYGVTPNAAGTKSSGTFTPDVADGNFQTATNGGAHTLAPPSADCTIIIQYTNNGSAGAITTSGFTKVSGAFTTTNGDDFFCYITKVGSFSFLNIVALQ